MVFYEKKIGILGSGVVGQALAKGFIAHGFQVMIGTNTKGKYHELLKITEGKAQVGSFEETANFAQIVVLAVKGTAAELVLQIVGEENLHGKTVIDATNPIADVPPVNGVLQYFTSQNESLMERLQELAPHTHFVKAFSCVGSALMVEPDLGGDIPTMFICGNNENAKHDVKEVLSEFGWEYEDMGMVEAARAIEPLAMLWCIPGFRNNEWAHAFKLLRA